MSTNYYDTFIEVADDCPVSVAEVPQRKGETMTVAVMQFEMIAEHPYEYTQDDVLFEVFAERQGIAVGDGELARIRFFEKGQPCLRASPLGKRYGWGTHHGEHGRVAVVAVDSDQYRALANDAGLRHLKAMRSRRG